MKIGIAHKTVAEVRSFTTQDVRLNPKVYITDSGKEGEFIYDSTDTTTADNLGTVLVSGSARYKRVFDVVVRPEWFGALGDNSTYDTTAFQNTFTFASAFGYDVELYKKTYKVSTLTVPDNITIIGNKATLNQVRTSGTAVPVLILGSNNKVSYLNIICDPVTTPDQNSGGIYAGSKSNIDISNCYIKNHGVFGIHINACKNVNILKNRLWTNYQLSTLLVYGGWEQTTDIYIYSPSNGVSEKILVEGNRCNSPFTSQGIWANGEGNDREIVITNNFCITTNEDGTDWTNTNLFYDVGNGMIRRHGIQFGYQGLTGCGSAIISNNICRRTSVTGIYIAGQGIGKGVVVANNHCIENGYTTNTDDFLAGGIDIGAGLGNILVTGNQIVDFKCTSFQSGAINIQRNTSVANNHNVTLADNAIINSAGQGYRILSGADRVIINGGSITNSALIDIYYDNSPATLDNWLTISNLSILRNNIANRSIWIDTYYPKKIELSNITIKGIDSVTNDTLNCAIFINNPNNPLLIRNCTIDNFFYGIYYNNAVIGRKKDLVVSDNYFKNTQIAIFAEAYFPNQAFIVGHNNRFDNVTLFQYQNNYRCYYEGQYRPNDNISIYVPNINVATGSWKQGDRLITEAPIQGDAETNICTVSGTFGTLLGVTGGITSGTKTLVVNVTTDLSVDMYINIVGVTGTKRITAISGTTITIDTNADATVSGAAISYQTPSFITSVNL
jgi:hypothetical protein